MMRGTISSDPKILELHLLNVELAARLNPQAHYIVSDDLDGMSPDQLRQTMARIMEGKDQFQN
jgi:hypothetical protein